MKKSSIKNLIIIVVIVAALLALYILFIKPDAATPSGTLTSSTTGSTPLVSRTTNTDEASRAGDSLLRVLNSLNDLELNDSIFFNPAFKELQDIGIPLIKEGNAGRRNPFAPIGTDPIPAPVTNGSLGNNGVSDDFFDNQTTSSNESVDDAHDGGFGLFGI